MAPDTRYDRFAASFDGPVKKNEPLSAYTTFRTGGNADLFIDVTDSGALAQAIRLSRHLNIPCFLIGGGSNLLVSDSGYRGLIIRNSLRCLEVKGSEVKAGAGELLDTVVDFATDRSLTGFEFAAGIWGTVGGAVYGNAGAFGSQVGAILREAEIIDANGEIRVEPQAYFRFAYRHSRLKETGEIVTWARFVLEPGDKAEIGKRTAEIRALREHKHPVTPCSAGCFFKNVEDDGAPSGKLAAGKLLEEIGAKDLTVGGAGVFGKHANIIVNTGSASSKDIRRLADILKERVRKRFNIELQEEVISLGEF